MLLKCWDRFDKGFQIVITQNYKTDLSKFKVEGLILSNIIMFYNLI
jgi:hypothetical protein